MTSLSKNISAKRKSQIPVSIEQVMNPFLGLRQEVAKAMSDFYNFFEKGDTQLDKFENLKLLPAIDLVEEKNCYKILAEMPGMDQRDIHVAVNENMLTIHGEKSLLSNDKIAPSKLVGTKSTGATKSASTKNKTNFIAREISYGRYIRTIALPLLADASKITASFKKGLLWITIPKKAGSKPTSREITITKA